MKSGVEEVDQEKQVSHFHKWSNNWGRCLLFLLVATVYISVAPEANAACPDLEMRCPTGEKFSRGMSFKGSSLSCKAAKHLNTTIRNKCEIPSFIQETRSVLNFWREPAGQKTACSGPIGDLMSGSSTSPWMNEACIIHDICYRSQVSRKECDADFIENLDNICSYQPSLLGLAKSPLCGAIQQAISILRNNGGFVQAYGHRQGQLKTKFKDLIEMQITNRCDGCRYSGQAVAVKGSGVSLTSAVNTTATQWKIQYEGPDRYKIVNGGNFLNIDGGTGRINLTRGNGSGTNWKAIKISNGNYRFQNMCNCKFRGGYLNINGNNGQLTLTDPAKQVGTRRVGGIVVPKYTEPWKASGTKWRVRSTALLNVAQATPQPAPAKSYTKPAPAKVVTRPAPVQVKKTPTKKRSNTKYFRIRAAHSDACLGIAGNSQGRANLVHAPAQKCSAAPNMLFKRDVGKKRWGQIRVKHTNGCLGVAGGSRGRSNIVHVPRCDNVDTFKYKFVNAGKHKGRNSYYIKVKHTKGCLAVAGGSRNRAEIVHVPRCDPTPNFKFVLLPVS